jgi:hypothetical protein
LAGCDAHTREFTMSATTAKEKLWVEAEPNGEEFLWETMRRGRILRLNAAAALSWELLMQEDAKGPTPYKGNEGVVSLLAFLAMCASAFVVVKYGSIGQGFGIFFQNPIGASGLCSGALFFVIAFWLHQRFARKSYEWRRGHGDRMKQRRRVFLQNRGVTDKSCAQLWKIPELGKPFLLISDDAAE